MGGPWPHHAPNPFAGGMVEKGGGVNRKQIAYLFGEDEGQKRR